MIKPSQIREKEFAKSTMGGYKTSEVNSFMEDVADSYDQLYRENSELLKKLRLLVDNIEQYRKKEQEGAFTPDTSVSDAKAEADRIISEAKREAERIVAEAKSQAEQYGADYGSVDEIRKLREIEEKSLCEIKGEADKFRKSLISMYTEHLTLIQSMVNTASAAREEATRKEKRETAEQLQQQAPCTQVSEPEEVASEEDIDALFAEAVSDEKSRMREAFGGFRFEMGVETTDEVQLQIEQPQDVADTEDIHSEAEVPEIIVLHDEPTAEAEQPTQEEASQTTQGETYQSSQEEVYYDMEIQDDQEENDDSDDGEDKGNDDVEPGFKISFPVDEEDDDGEEENLDDLFEGFFNSFDKH